MAPENGMDHGKDLLENLGGAAQIAWALATPFLRRARVGWGATEEEMGRVFPGDELVPHPRWQFIHAITIDAPAETVWPWIAQIGQGRAGFYSFERLENLFGCAIDNAAVVHPEWQAVAQGDPIRLHPKAPALRLALVEPGHVLVLHGDSRVSADGRAASSAQQVNVSWAFVVDPLSNGQSRLFSRNRADYGPGLVNSLAYGSSLIEPISFVMDRKMLRGIKSRAETHAGDSPTLP